MTRSVLGLVVAAVACLASIGPAGAATLVNGSLTGPIANAGVPTPWTISLNSPDTMDETHNVGVTTVPFGVTPSGPSPDGGTWVGMWGSHAGGAETFGQDVTGFVVGREYTLSWYQANFGIGGSLPSTDADTIEVLIDGVPVGAGALVPLGPDWSYESLSFTATATSHRIDFRPGIPANSYISIDGIQLSCCSGDLDGDGAVTLTDFSQFLACFQTCPPQPACVPADINCDGCVDLADYEILACQLELGVPDPACCESPPPQVANESAFCIDGEGDGSGWTWRFGTFPDVAVIGPLPPSTAKDLRDAFVASIGGQAIAGLVVKLGPGGSCFQLTYLGPVVLWVGPPQGPAACLVSGNPAGCPFNPRIYEQPYFPHAIPSLPAWGVTVLAMLLSGLLMAVVRRA